MAFDRFRASNQCVLVMNHLKIKGTITAIEAERMGIRRLGARIYELKKIGVDIEREMVEVNDRFGESVMVAKYSLVKKQVQGALFEAPDQSNQG